MLLKAPSGNSTGRNTHSREGNILRNNSFPDFVRLQVFTAHSSSGLPESIIFFMVVSEHMVDDFPRGLFDGFVRSIDDFPDPVLLGEVPDILDLGKDLLEFAVARRERGLFLAHPPDFLKDLGIDYQTDDLLLIDFEKLFGQGDARDDRDIGDLVALLGQKDRGGGLGRPRKSDDNDLMKAKEANNLSGRQLPWSPLRQYLFRSLWIAAVVSNVGTWVEDIGVAWLMTSLTKSPVLISLLQTAESLPIFLLALPAGAFAGSDGF
jgi:hypothetical protein